MLKFNLSFKEPQPFKVSFDEPESFKLTMGQVIEVERDVINYEGVYEVTPANTGLTLSTANKKLLQNVIVNPIPSNYGKISWNGSTMTIS